FYARGPAENIRIRNNTIFNVERVIDSNITDDKTTSLDFSNNVVHMGETGILYLISANSELTSSNNIIFPESNRFIRYKGTNYDTLASFQNATQLDLNSMAVDPLFSSTGLGGF